jgi:hypothetical protein
VAGITHKGNCCCPVCDARGDIVAVTMDVAKAFAARALEVRMMGGLLDTPLESVRERIRAERAEAIAAAIAAAEEGT